MRRRWFGEDDSGGFEVWPDNWRAFQFFTMSATQWRRDAMGNLSGLDYPALQSLFVIHRIPARQWARLFSDVRLIECGALDAARESD